MSTSSEHECPFHGPGCVADPREGQDFDWREPVLCHRCRVLAIDGSGWPADDGPLCQICWEDDCARSFWEEARRREG